MLPCTGYSSLPQKPVCSICLRARELLANFRYTSNIYCLCWNWSVKVAFKWSRKRFCVSSIFDVSFQQHFVHCIKTTAALCDIAKFNIRRFHGIFIYVSFIVECFRSFYLSFMHTEVSQNFTFLISLYVVPSIFKNKRD